MPNTPLISVIIPIYNMEKYLPECLDSVINQTYKNIEILCIDDGSTDASSQILESYASRDKRIKVFHTKNNGQASARNIGLQYCHGDYIGFVDSDDYISNEFYENLLRACIQNNADISMTNVDFVIDAEVIPFRNYCMQTVCDFESMLNVQDTGSVSNKLFKRNVLFDKGNLRFEFPVGLRWEDSFYLINALYHAQKLSLTNEATYFYRQSAVSTMNNPKNQERNTQDRLAVSDKIYSLFQKHPEYRQSVVNYIINVVIAPDMLVSHPDVRAHFEQKYGLRVRIPNTYEITKVSCYLFGIIQLLKIIYDETCTKYRILWIPFFKLKKSN